MSGESQEGSEVARWSGLHSLREFEDWRRRWGDPDWRGMFLSGFLMRDYSLDASPGVLVSDLLSEDGPYSADVP